MQAFTHLSNIYPVSGTGDKKMKQSPWPQGINILEQGSANSPLHGQMVNILGFAGHWPWSFCCSYSVLPL